MFSLRWKLVFFTSLILIVACTSLGWYLIAQQSEARRQSLLDRGVTLANQLVATGRYSVFVKDDVRLSELMDGALQNSVVLYVVFADRTGQIVAFKTKPATSEEAKLGSLSFPFLHFDHGPLAVESDFNTPRAVSFRMKNGQPITDSQGEYYDLAAPIFRTELGSGPAEISDDHIPDSHISPSPAAPALYGVVHVGLSTLTLRRDLQTTVERAGLITLLTMLGGISMTLLLAHRLTGPLTRLRNLAGRVAAGDLSASVEPSSRDEIGELTRVFNVMTAGLNARTRESAHALHQLEELNRSLDARVKERTLELEAANGKLKELDQLKSKFVSTASHELRTPLTSMKVYIENLLDGVCGSLSAGQQESMYRIQAGHERLRRTIDDLLDLSRIESGRMALANRAASISEIISRVAETLQAMSAQKRITVAIELAQPLPLVWGDADKLEQVLMNLVGNAVKFSPERGTIKIEAHDRGAGYVEIAVVDYGCGIPLQEQEKVFLPFYRSNDTPSPTRGAGLGLAIAKELVELHNGRLWVESVPGKGSRFAFIVPAWNDQGLNLPISTQATSAPSSLGRSS